MAIRFIEDGVQRFKSVRTLQCHTFSLISLDGCVLYTVQCTLSIFYFYVCVVEYRSVGISSIYIDNMCNVYRVFLLKSSTEHIHNISDKRNVP